MARPLNSLTALRLVLENTIDKLPQPSAKLLRMRFLECRTLREIEDELGIPRASIFSRIAIAFYDLHPILENDGFFGLYLKWAGFDLDRLFTLGKESIHDWRS